MGWKCQPEREQRGGGVRRGLVLQRGKGSEGGITRRAAGRGMLGAAAVPLEHKQGASDQKRGPNSFCGGARRPPRGGAQAGGQARAVGDHHRIMRAVPLLARLVGRSAAAEAAHCSAATATGRGMVAAGSAGVPAPAAEAASAWAWAASRASTLFTMCLP